MKRTITFCILLLGIVVICSQISCNLFLSRDKNGLFLMNDTLFVYRNVWKEKYTAVYVDTSKTSSRRRIFTDFKFSSKQKSSYQYDYKLLKDFDKIPLSDFPREWLPVQKYKDKYYLYEHNHPEFFDKILFTDSTMTLWDSNNVIPCAVSNFNKFENKVDFMYDIYHLGKNKVIVHEISQKTKLSIFEFTAYEERRRYRLMIPKEMASDLNLLVYYTNYKIKTDYNINSVAKRKYHFKETTNELIINSNYDD